MNPHVMNFKDETVLVTGAAGFLGSHLVEDLLSLDNKVIGLDNLSGGTLTNLKKALKDTDFRFIEGDVRNGVLLEETIKNVNYVFHLAALIDVQASIDDPKLFNDVNVGGTLNVLSGALHNDVDKVIFASSAAVYGEQEKLPIKENVDLNPITPYGLTKLIGEKYCLLFHKIYGLNTVIVRFFNVYGPRQNPLSPYSGVISRFISNAISGDSLRIFGDGEQTRDFVFVEDVVSANLLAASDSRANNKIFNIGSGRQVSINQLADRIIVLSKNPAIEIEHVQPRKGDIKHSKADITLAKTVLGYEQSCTLREGLKQTADWFNSAR